MAAGEIPDDILMRYLNTGNDSEVVNYLIQRNYGDFVYMLEYNKQMQLQEQEQEKPGILKRIFGGR